VPKTVRNLFLIIKIVSLGGFEFGPKPDFGMNVLRVTTFDVPSGIWHVAVGERPNRFGGKWISVVQSPRGTGAGSCGAAAVMLQSLRVFRRALLMPWSAALLV
jgi:hypothetical protein